MSLGSSQVAELALGDLHGSLAGGLAPDGGALNGTSVSVGGLSMSLSEHGLSSRCAPSPLSGGVYETDLIRACKAVCV